LVRVAETEAEPESNLIEAEIVKDSLVDTVPPTEPDGAEILMLSTLTFGSATKFAVIVPIPPIVAVVVAELELVKVMEPLLLDQ
jgi:hypothetical protein